MVNSSTPGRARLFTLFLTVGILFPAVLGAADRSVASTQLDLVVRKNDFKKIELVRAKSRHRVADGVLLPQPTVRTGSIPFETWVHRLSPGEPAVVDLIDRSSGQPVPTRVPGLEASFSEGLNDFIEYRLMDDGGRILYEGTQPFCPNGFGGGGYTASVFGHLDPDENGPYPIYPQGDFYGICGEEQAESLVWFTGPGNPVYTFGSKSFRLRDGDYRFEATLNPDGAIPERTLANNRIVQRFSLTTNRKRWRKLILGSQAGLRSTALARTPLGHRGNEGSSVAPPIASQIKGPPGALPDPAALAASKFGYDLQRGRARISFSSIVANFGEAPISLFGKRKQKKSTTMPGWQYLKDMNGNLSRRSTNGFVWDRRDGHKHWHYNKLAVYELLSMDGDVLRRSSKVGFCFMPTTALLINPLPGPVGSGTGFGYGADSDLSVSCGQRDSKRVSMALESGWGDEYFQGIAGQSLDVTSLPVGQYRLRITVNPEGDLAESNPANNVSERLIELGGTGLGRTLTVPRQGIVGPEFRRIAAGRSSGAFYRSAFRSGGQAAASRLLCGLVPAN